MRQGLLYSFAFVLLVVRAFPQQNEVLQVNFEQFFQNYSLVNPAATGKDSPVEGFAGYRTNVGAFEGVNTNYAGFNIGSKIKDSLDQDHHGFGVNLINSREGNYFNRNRLYASYAWHEQITENWFLSGGAMFGIINYQYKATDVYPGGTATKPTTDLGLMFYKPQNTYIGLCATQLIKGNMGPLEPLLQIKPSLVFTAEKTLPLSPYLGWRSAFIFRGLWQKAKPEYDLTTMLVIQEVISLGVHYKINEGISFVGGVDAFQMENFGLRFFISYFSSFANSNTIPAPVLQMTCAVYKR
jgi:type IX secretion system PorP/SprF family membrane protein